MKYKPFYQKHSRAMRLWHWSTFIVTGFLFYSVFVGKFYLNPYNNTALIHDQLQQLGVQHDPDPSYPVAKALSKSVWDWHIKYGYVLTGLFLLRILIAIFQRREEEVLHKIKNAFSLIKRKEEGNPARHYLMVRLIYLLFYFLLTAIVGTGLWLSFNRQSPDGELVHSVKQVHETCFYLLFLFIFIHITGVIRAERKGHQNIVSDMINGGREKK